MPVFLAGTDGQLLVRKDTKIGSFPFNVILNFGVLRVSA